MHKIDQGVNSPPMMSTMSPFLKAPEPINRHHPYSAGGQWSKIRDGCTKLNFFNAKISF